MLMIASPKPLPTNKSNPLVLLARTLPFGKPLPPGALLPNSLNICMCLFFPFTSHKFVRAYAQFDKPFTGSKPRICALTEVIKQLCAVKPLALTESEIALAFGLPDPSSPPSPSPTPSPTPSPSPADNKPVRKRKAPEKFDEDLPKLHKRPKASSSRSHHLNSPSDAEMVFFNDVPYRSLGDLHRDARALLLQKDEEIRFLNGIIAEMKLQKAVVDTSLENKLELITYMKQQIETLQKQLATR